MICASIYLEKLAAIFLLRLRHALGNSSRRIGALSYNSYAGKTTGELLFGASGNCSQQSSRSAFDTRLAILLEELER